jgi:hypothetical protein
MFTLLAYFASANNQAAGVVADAPAVADPNYSQRNNHYIFTEDYVIPAAAALGATLTAAQIDSATIDAWNPFQVYPTIAGGIIPPANPNVMDLRQMPIAVPKNEEISFKLAGGAGGAEPDYGIYWLKAAGAGATEYPIPTPTPQAPRFWAIGTATIVLTAGVWSPLVNMAFTNTLRGGMYQLNGLNLVCAHSIAYRINFLRSPLYQGRKMYPGSLVENAYSNQILRFGPNWLGGLGRFNYFELPQIQVLGSTTTGSATYTFYADLSYLGQAATDQIPF